MLKKKKFQLTDYSVVKYSGRNTCLELVRFTKDWSKLLLKASYSHQIYQDEIQTVFL